MGPIAPSSAPRYVRCRKADEIGIDLPCHPGWFSNVACSNAGFVAALRILPGDKFVDYMLDEVCDKTSRKQFPALEEIAQQSLLNIPYAPWL